MATSSPQHTHFPKPAPSQRPGGDTVPLGMCCEPMSQPLRDSDSRVALQPHREAGLDWKEGMGGQDPEPSPGHKGGVLVCTSQATARRAVWEGPWDPSQATGHVGPEASHERERCSDVRCPKRKSHHITVSFPWR